MKQLIEDIAKALVDLPDEVNVSEVQGEQELLVKLRELRHSSSAPSHMLVLGNSEAKHWKVVMVLDAGSDAGMDEVQLAVDDES